MKTKKKVQTDKVVNSPDHYTWIDGIECIDIAEHFDICLGSALQYIWRAGRKGDNEDLTIQDLKKAIWYINRRIHNLQGHSKFKVKDSKKIL